jgi:hypothetical protein
VLEVEADFASHCTFATAQYEIAVAKTGATHEPDEDAPDFLRLVTAIQHLYSEEGVMEMQQLDRPIRKGVGSRATFQASSVTAESTRPSEVLADATIRNEYSVITKRSPTILFEENGTLRQNEEAQHAAESFIKEIRILGFPAI